MKRALWEPQLADTQVGGTEWFQRQAEIISARPLVKRTYDLWYSLMLQDAAGVEQQDAPILEIGSGSAYVKRLDPSVITSDVVPGNADLVVDAQNLPFEDRSLRAIFLTHVFHHIPNVTRFLGEAVRTLVPNGVIAMIDVAHTPLSRLVFGHFHHEDYDARASSWELDEANQALSWIVFMRDRARFANEYPELDIEIVEFLPWLGYLVSGGASRRSLVPSVAAGAIATVEQLLKPADPICALHWHIRIRKRG